MNKLLPSQDVSSILASSVFVRSGGEKPTVLVVEDDRRFADAIAHAFDCLKISCQVANDGNVGIAMAIVNRPNFMVVDSRMPCRSGYLVKEYLTANTDLEIPAIMLSENEGERHRRYAEMLGFVEFVEKPVSADAVALKVIGHMAQVLA